MTEHVQGTQPSPTDDVEFAKHIGSALGVVIACAPRRRGAFNYQGCVRSIRRLAKALGDEGIEVPVSVLGSAESDQLDIIESLGSLADKGSHLLLSADTNAATVMAHVLAAMPVRDVLIMSGGTSLSQEWIDSVRPHLRDRNGNEVLFPSQHVRYGDAFDAVDYTVDVDAALLRATTPFTELLPPIGIVSRTDAMDLLCHDDAPSWERTLALYRYQLQQRLLRPGPIANYRLLAGSTFDRAPEESDTELSIAWSAGVCIGAPIVEAAGGDDPPSPLIWLVDSASDELQKLAIPGGGSDQVLPNSLARSIGRAAQFDPMLLVDMPEEPRIRPVRPSALLGALAELITDARPSAVRIICVNAHRLDTGGPDVLLRLISALQDSAESISVIITEGLLDRPVTRPVDTVFLLDCEAFLRDELSAESLRAFLVWLLARFGASLLNQGINLVDETLVSLEPVTRQLDSGNRVRYLPSSQLTQGSVAIDFTGSPDADRKAIELLQSGAYDYFTSTPHHRRPEFIASLARAGRWQEPSPEVRTEVPLLMRLVEEMR